MEGAAPNLPRAARTEAVSQAVYVGLVLEFNLALGGGDVHVNGLGVHLEFQEIAGLGVGGDVSLETAEYALVEIGMAHVAAVDYEILERVAPAGMFGTGYEA